MRSASARPRRCAASSRARLADRDLPAAQQGWIHQDDLLGQLGWEVAHLNLDIHRIRRQFADTGIADAGHIVERRPGTRQMRIGASQLEIVTLAQRGALTPNPRDVPAARLPPAPALRPIHSDPRWQALLTAYPWRANVGQASTRIFSAPRRPAWASSARRSPHTSSSSRRARVGGDDRGAALTAAAEAAVGEPWELCPTVMPG